MAFDYPLEADRVDLNFASIMARAPVIGSLMYLLGHQSAREQEEEEATRRHDTTASVTETSSGSQISLSSDKPIKSALKKGSGPSLAPTEDSDNESFQSAADDCHDTTKGPLDGDGSFRRKKKELSWSDESGQELVQYMETVEISSSKEVPLANGFVAGNLARSRSIRQQLQDSESHRVEEGGKSFLPRMTPHGGGVVMPSMSNHGRQSPSGGGGIDSPQWGWYANCSLTPPSPEMYAAYSRSHRNSSSSSASSSFSHNSKPKRPSSTKPNPIFQSLPSQRKDRVSQPAVLSSS